MADEPFVSAVEDADRVPGEFRYCGPPDWHGGTPRCSRQYWHGYGDRRAAIRFLIGLAEITEPGEQVRAEEALMTLGVNPVELIFASSPASP